MKTIISLLAISVLFISLASTAKAEQMPPMESDCTTTTIFADGKIIMCTTCCYGSNCTVSCL